MYLPDEKRVRRIGLDPSTLGLALTPDGKYLFAAGSGTIRQWDVGSGTLVRTYTDPGGVGRSLDADDRFLVSGGIDKTGHVWEIGSGRHLATLKGHFDAITAIRIRILDNTVITAGSRGDLRLWSLPDGKFLRALPY